MGITKESDITEPLNNKDKLGFWSAERASLSSTTAHPIEILIELGSSW